VELDRKKGPTGSRMHDRSQSSLAEDSYEINKMTQFLLFVMTILLILIFWELSKIHTRLKSALRTQMESAKRSAETTNIKVA
jgi:hypothetical protein